MNTQMSPHSSNPIARLLTILGMVCVSAKQHNWALSLLNSALLLDNAQVLTYIVRGNLLQDIWRYGEALADFDFAIQLNPNRDDLLAMRGELFFEMGNIDMAMQDLSLAIEKGCKEPNIFNMRGELHLHLGAFEPALDDFESSISLNPQKAWPHSQKSEICRRLGQMATALSASDRAVDLEPNDSYMFAMRSRILEHMGRHEEAKSNIVKALENHDTDPWDIYGHAATYVVGGDLPKALSLLAEALHRDRTLRVDLRFDPAFEALRQENEFQQLFNDLPVE